MDRQQFIIATAVTLFAAFLIGWFGSWLVNRLTRTTWAEIGALDSLAGQLHEAEDARDAAVGELERREAALSTRLVAAEEDLRAATDALADSQTEIEELRQYIDQRLTRLRGGKP